MVGIAQLVERWLVVPDVAGSSPVTHPREEGLNPRIQAFFVLSRWRSLYRAAP